MTSWKWLGITTGLVAANLLGVAFCLAFVLLFQLPDRAGLSSRVQPWFYGVAVMTIWPSLVLVPMAIGIAAAYCWRSLSFNLWKYFFWWIVTALISPFGAYFAFKEGAVCLLIGFPILFVCGFAGVLVGRLLFKSKTATIKLSAARASACHSDGRQNAAGSTRRGGGLPSHQCSGHRSVKLHYFVSGNHSHVHLRVMEHIKTLSERKR